MTAVQQHIPFQNLVSTITSQNGQQRPQFTHPEAQLQVELDVERRLQAKVAKDRVRIKEFFLDFDKLRKGTCSEAAFRTCIGTLGISMTEEENQQLIQKYRCQDASGLINYYKFCDNINQVFTEHVDPNKIIQGVRSTAVFTDREKDIMVNTLQEIRQQVVSNRILLKPCFMDYDRSKSCHITAAQFQRVLKSLTLMPPQETVYNLIIRKYCDKGNTKEVNYFDFCKDVDRPQDMFPQYVPKHPVPEPSFNTEKVQVSTFHNESDPHLDVISNRFQKQRIETANDPNDVEKRLQAAIVMKRVRIEEFFRDFDKLRKGRVTKNQFKSILSMMNFTMTDNEFNYLAQKYETNDPERFFNYAAFTDNMNLAFTTKGIDKKPTVKVAPVTADDTILARRKYLDGNNPNDMAIYQILEEYRTAVNNRRIHLKPQFQDFDITRNGHVTKQQFLRVLCQLGVQAPDHISNMLLKRYMDKGNADEVNYVDFCNEIDSPQQVFGVGRDFNHSFDYFPKSQPKPTEKDIIKDQPNDIDDVVASIRQKCSQQRIRIGEFFRDFDKLRSGYITAAQFRIGLNMAKCVISAAEFKLLLDTFRAPKAGDHIKWREFCDVVDEVFTKKGLEKNVDIALDDARTNRIYGRQAASKVDKKIVENVVARFKEVIMRQRLDAKSFFQDFDRHKHFKVSPKQFRQVLTTLGFPINENDMQSIILVYGNEANEIKYLEFLADSSCLQYTINGPTTGAKSTYNAIDGDFSGDKEMQKLLLKIWHTIKKDRIRLTEFFQDHDMLRKGNVPAQKFRSVLHAQKLQLTMEEYDRLEKYFALPNDATRINYIAFCEGVDKIFTEKDLEKNPTKKLTAFNAPSILDPKNVLDDEEEKNLHDCLMRIGTDVRYRRLLLKPYFQDKDSSRSGFIAQTRFRSIFDNFKMQLSEYEYDLIGRRFQAKSANEINYVEFDYVLRHYSGDHEPV